MMNLDYLQKLMGGDPEKVKQFLGIFAMEVPRQLQELRSAISSQSWEEASITAHSMKSQLRYLSLDALAQLAQQIENETDQSGHSSSIEALLIELEQQLQIVLKEVELKLAE